MIATDEGRAHLQACYIVSPPGMWAKAIPDNLQALLELGAHPLLRRQAG